MTSTYLDSSAFMRLCLQQGNLALVHAALETLPVSSRLLVAEAHNSISSKFHRGLITSSERNAFFHQTDSLLAQVSLFELTGDVFAEADAIGARFLVRTLDAIHLGTAVVAARQQKRRGNQLRFCTADVRQHEAAVSLFGAAAVDLVPRVAG